MALCSGGGGGGGEIVAIYVLPGHHISILFTLSSKNTNFQNLRLRSTSVWVECLHRGFAGYLGEDGSAWGVLATGMHRN